MPLPEVPADLPEHAMVCECCGARRAAAHARMRQNIGVLVFRHETETEGNPCGPCLGRLFRKMTLVTVAVGWIGMKSIFIAPIVVVSNVFSYVHARKVLSKAPKTVGESGEPRAAHGVTTRTTEGLQRDSLEGRDRSIS